MITLHFYKDNDNKWYVDLPDWTGPKSALEMVMGADTLLEYFAEDSGKVTLCMSQDSFKNSDVLKFQRNTPEYGEGALYKIEMIKNIPISLDVWLCDVTLFVFGVFPENIFISHI